MTRFARAKGSKSSNERVPEEATSWSEMKQQLLEKNGKNEENNKRKEVISQRYANYKAFLEEEESKKSKNTTWADFPGLSKPKQKKLKEEVKPVSKSKKNKRNNNFEIENLQESSADEDFAVLKSRLDQVLNNNKPNSDNDEPPEELSAKKEAVKSVVKIKKTKLKKPLKIVIDAKSDMKLGESKEEIGKFKKKRKAQENDIGIRKKLKSENDKSKVAETSGVKSPKKKIAKDLTEKDLKKIEKKKLKRLKQLEKKKRLKAELKKQKEEMKSKEESDDKGNEVNQDKSLVKLKKKINNSLVKNNSAFQTHKSSSVDIKKKNLKVRDKNEHLRKKPVLPKKMFINGKELEIEYVDGFPVKKEDAVRLKKLRKEMISKGLPRSEINIALKLERRKAEKAFAREKKKVCFNCRKSGHNLSECPELNKNQVAQTSGSGICFKCGSTEHTHFECKVVRGQEFKFAQCFICNEQGHIARQCPDNARGLYPKGGACKVCGDVTHLKKDCPKFQEQQQRQESTIKIESFGDNNPDVLEENSENSGRKVVNKRSNKIIKF